MKIGKMILKSIGRIEYDFDHEGTSSKFVCLSPTTMLMIVISMHTGKTI